MNINIPETGFANSPVETDELIDMVGGTPLIVKLLESSQGKGVFLAETKKAAQSVINGFKMLKANLLVQEFIKESSGQDIRCFVLGGRVISAYKRIAAPDEFRANIHLGGVAEKVTITSKIKSIATKACKSLNLDVAGVDIINSSRGPLVLEVNSSPGLEGIEAVSQKDIAGLLIKHIEKKLKFKKSN
jgi:ribosomal protein S6--L-glutamate ligase